MASIPCFCRECGKQESPNLKLLRCSPCNLVVYCSKECQRKNWKDHKPYCKSIQAFQSDHENHAVTSAQRQQMGTSDGNESRMNPRAKELVDEARGHKKACRYDQAIFLYNQAIELDPFNNMYYHHRSETWMLAVEHFKSLTSLHRMYLGYAVLDAQAALDLAPLEDVPWLTMVKSSLITGDLDSAEKYLGMALQTVPDDAYSRRFLVNYQSELEQMRMAPDSFPKCVSVMEKEDKYWYAYSNGMHNHGRQPELIVLDLEMARYNSGMEIVMKWLFSQTLGGTIDLDFGNVFQVPEGPWVTPIPVSVMEDPEATREGILPLMGMVQSASNICVLKFDYDDKPNPLPIEKAKAYLQIVVSLGKEVPKLYREGKKLVPGDVPSV